MKTLNSLSRLILEKQLSRAYDVCGVLIIAMTVLFLTTVTGCVGFVDGGGGGGVVVAEPDFWLFGGGYDRGYDAHGYSHRGSASWGAAHGGGHRR